MCHLIQQTNHYSPPSDFNWKLETDMESNLHPRHKLLGWKIGSNALATLDILYQRGISNVSACFICGVEVETIQHLFAECPFISTIWVNSI